MNKEEIAGLSDEIKHLHWELFNDYIYLKWFKKFLTDGLSASSQISDSPYMKFSLRHKPDMVTGCFMLVFFGIPSYLLIIFVLTVLFRYNIRLDDLADWLVFLVFIFMPAYHLLTRYIVYRRWRRLGYSKTIASRLNALEQKWVELKKADPQAANDILAYYDYDKTSCILTDEYFKKAIRLLPINFLTVYLGLFG